MSWNCEKIGCPFADGNNCTHEGTCVLMEGSRYDYPYIKNAFDKCKLDAVEEFAERLKKRLRFSKCIEAILDKYDFPVIKESQATEVINEVLQEMRCAYDR